MLSSNSRNTRSLKSLKGLFDLPLAEIKTIIKKFHAEMDRGLSGQASSLKMLPSYLDVPTGDEKGAFMAIDLGGTNLRVLSLILKGGRKISSARVRKFILQKRHITGNADKFFGFIADCVNDFLKHEGPRKRHAEGLGFTFSFPVRQKGVASGELVRWTKGFTVRGVEGRNVVELFNRALARKGTDHMRVSVLANDTVGTLVARAYRDPRCDVGVILGTGTNACYVEKLSNIRTCSGARKPGRSMIINIEWGNFNGLRSTAYDRELDRQSENKGLQILEKMVSGMYIGELVRLVCKDLGIRCIRKDAFKAEHVSRIEADRSRDLSDVKSVLALLGVKGTTIEDRAVVKKACQIVSFRAARVSAASLIAVITKMDPALRRHHTVAIDGSVYEKHPHFSSHVAAALREVLGKKASRIRMVLTKDGSGIGAAIAASTVYPAAQHRGLKAVDRWGGMSHRKEETTGFSPGGLHA